MVFNDAKGKYSIKVDKVRHILYYEQIGLWELGDFHRFYEDYGKAVSQLKNTSWVIYDDLTKYKPSTNVSPELMNKIVELAAENGVACAALLVESATLKMQLNRSNKGDSPVEAVYFSEAEEADKWLKSKGF